MAGGTKTDRGTNRLTDRQIRAFIVHARAGTAATKKLSDGGGLFLMLNTAGSPAWRVKYRVNGKERLAGPGIYPEVSLVEARATRDAIRHHLRFGRDPSIERVNRGSSSVTFRDIATEWLEMRRKGWSKIHFEKSSQAIHRDVMPKLGGYRVADITAAIVAPVVQAIAGRGTHTFGNAAALNAASVWIANHLRIFVEPQQSAVGDFAGMFAAQCVPMVPDRVYDARRRTMKMTLHSAACLVQETAALST